MSFESKVVNFSVKSPWKVTYIMLGITFFLAVLAILPSIWPNTFKMLNPAVVDTDPENMLPEDEPVRVYHDNMKKEMSLYDMVVVGIVNEKHPDGVFNPESLKKIYELAEYAKTLRWPDKENPGEYVGVREVDMIAPSMVDNIEQGGPGVVRFEWLMQSPPETKEESLAVRKKAERIPFLNGTLISEDGKAICLYLPITSKDLSYKIYSELNKKIATFSGDEEYHITGLPVAEDTFGVEMFKQMAISAPLAMLIIFLLMLYFFRKLVLIISPLIVAMVSVICTMALLVISGKTIHIMSSMIPIFIMPIAVLDAVHILSDFFDRYQETKDRKKTIKIVMEELFLPMFYTSITTAAGFASLALTPIPPVQVFGLFITFGVLIAWITTITFIPAYIMFIKDKSLENFGTVHTDEEGESKTILSRMLQSTGRFTFNHVKIIMTVVLIMVLIAIYGISKIEINDNPIKWFHKSHMIRVADKVLNEHFGGTYMGYLALEAPEKTETPAEYAKNLSDRIDAKVDELKEVVDNADKVFGILKTEAGKLKTTASSKEDLLKSLVTFAESKLDEAPDDMYDAWDEALLFLDEERQLGEVFKQPNVLEYISGLQNYLLTTGVVGKSNSLSDIIKTVYRELISGEEKDFKIPNSSNAVAQCMITYQNSHRPQDLWHFVTPDYRKSVLWVQLRSGDNRDMSKVVKDVEEYMTDNPPPFGITHKWFGLTYINVIWQDKMVSGMLQSFLGSFLIVFLMMTIVYRSALWGFLSMIPLTVTIGVIYGVIGIIGKDYDMPVAVLSSLSLGLAVDYAIHFLSRSRMHYEQLGSWANTYSTVFGEPARAITRNVVVIGVGFLPLLAAPLVPYQTVGIFIASILFAAGVATIIILPALIKIFERWLFPKTKLCCLMCNCSSCIISAVALVAAISINLHQFFSIGWTTLTWFSIIGIIILAGACALTSRREKCRIDLEKGEQQ